MRNKWSKQREINSNKNGKPKYNHTDNYIEY